MNRNTALCRQCLPADRTVSPDSMNQELLALRLSLIPPVMALNPVSSFSIGGILNSITSGLGSVLGGGGGAATAAAGSSNWLNNLMQIGGTIGGLALARELGGGQQNSGGAGAGIITGGQTGGLVSLGSGQFYNPATGQIINSSATGAGTGTSGTPSWVMPAAVIGGALLLYLAVKKR